MTGPPIYTQTDVAQLMAVPKYVKYDAWANRLRSRQTVGEQCKKLQVWPEDENNLTEFWVEARHRPIGRVKTSLTLYAKIPGRNGHAVCRYDVQDQKHTNHPKWFLPRYVGRLVAHRHIFNEKAVREGHSWDACAEPLHLGDVGPVEHRIERTARVFLSDTNITVHDPDAMGTLFDPSWS